MAAREALQLGVVALFPLGVVGLMLAAVARQRGRSRRQIGLGLAGIGACLFGVIGTGVALTALRGGPLFDLSATSFSLGTVGAADVAGLIVCAGCLVAALRLSKWLTSGKDGNLPPVPLPSEGGERPGEDG